MCFRIGVQSVPETQLPAFWIKGLSDMSASENAARTVLVVEDDPEASAEIVNLLTDSGYICQQAYDGLTALAKLRGEPTVGIIVTDIAMPRMDGLAFIESMRAQWNTGIDKQVIFITGQPELEKSIRALKLGAIDFIQKPINPDELLAAMRTGSETYEMRRQELVAQERASHAVSAMKAVLDRIDVSGWVSPASLGATQRPSRTPSDAPADNWPARKAEPDSKVDIVRRIIRSRAARNLFFDADLFADPCWNMLLDLAAHHFEGKKISISSLCIASGVPQTTALRRIEEMVACGLVMRTEDPHDGRRIFVELTPEAKDKFERYIGAFSASP